MLVCLRGDQVNDTTVDSDNGTNDVARADAFQNLITPIVRLMNALIMFTFT